LSDASYVPSLKPALSSHIILSTPKLIETASMLLKLETKKSNVRLYSIE